jgi:hypothetical protein
LAPEFAYVCPLISGVNPEVTGRAIDICVAIWSGTGWGKFTSVCDCSTNVDARSGRPLRTFLAEYTAVVPYGAVVRPETLFVVSDPAVARLHTNGWQGVIVREMTANYSVVSIAACATGSTVCTGWTLNYLHSLGAANRGHDSEVSNLIRWNLYVE